MNPNVFIEKMNKQISPHGVLLTTYYGTFERFRECSDKFITVQLHIPTPGVVFNIASGERGVVEKIFSVSELQRMPCKLINDYIIYILNELHEVLEKHQKEDDF